MGAQLRAHGLPRTTFEGGVAIAAALAGAVTGALAAGHPALALGAVCLAAYLLLLLVDLALGIALWAALTSLRGLGELGVLHTAASVLVVVAWGVGLAMERSGRRRTGGPDLVGSTRAALRSESQLVVLLSLLLLWLTLSVTWAEDSAGALDALWLWYVGPLTVLVLATGMRTPRDVRLVMAGLMVGVVASVVLGLVGAVPPWQPTGGASDLVGGAGRLQGTAGDPNFLGAAIVPAALIGVGLATTAGRTGRFAAFVAVALLVVGLIATQSRGGLLAAVGAGLLALVVLRGRRRRIAKTLVVLVGLTVVISLAIFPSAAGRLTSYGDQGNGREELWRVATRIGEAHPLAGVGLENFRLHSPLYVRRPGALQFVDLIAERPHEVHNTYLQLLAETGIIGLAAFLGVVAACLRAALLAARRFDQLGEARSATLARTALIATGGMLIAIVFISAGSSLILWPLLGFGPALWTVSRSQATAG